MNSITIKGTDEYKNSKYYGRKFDDTVIVTKYEHIFETDTYIINWKEK